MSHAYLFTGPRGTGKTTTARLLAKALLCECGPTPEPDGTCDDCVMIANGEHPDVYELDAASRTGVENVREEIIGRVQFAPTRGRYKIYIIDEVHMLSTAAFNALLKTLEEPPSHVVFILATTDPQKVPETIHSRCQRFDFRRISAESIVSRLGAICVSEDVEFEGEALDLIAHRAEGGMRNALTSLEQLIAFGEGKVTMEVAERLLGSIDTNDLAEIVRAIGTRDVASCFRWTAEYVETGADLAQFARDLAEHMRNMYVLSLAGADVALEVSETVRRELASELPLFGPDRLARLLGVLGDLSAELKTSTNPRLSFEIALTRMVRPDSDLTLEALAERIEALESGHSAVAHVIGGGAAAVAAPQVAAASAPQVSVAPVPASPLASPATQGAPMPASQPAAAPASAPGPDRASSAERAGAAPAAPAQTRRCSAGCGAVARGGRRPAARGGGRFGSSTRIARDAISGSVRRGSLRPAQGQPAESGCPAARVAGGAGDAQEEQGCLRRAVPQHESGVRRGQGHVDHRVPGRELVRLQGGAEARRAGSGVGRAQPGVRRVVALRVRAGRRGCHGGGSGRASCAVAGFRAVADAASDACSGPAPAAASAGGSGGFCSRAAPDARAGLRHTSVRGRGGSVRRRLRLVRADARACSGSSFGADACCRPGFPRLRLLWMLARRRRPSLRCSNRPKELQAILAAGFGDGVRVEEVRE